MHASDPAHATKTLRVQVKSRYKQIVIEAFCQEEFIQAFDYLVAVFLNVEVVLLVGRADDPKNYKEAVEFGDRCNHVALDMSRRSVWVQQVHLPKSSMECYRNDEGDLSW